MKYILILATTLFTINSFANFPERVYWVLDIYKLLNNVPTFKVDFEKVDTNKLNKWDVAFTYEGKDNSNQKCGIDFTKVDFTTSGLAMSFYKTSQNKKITLMNFYDQNHIPVYWLASIYPKTSFIGPGYEKNIIFFKQNNLYTKNNILTKSGESITFLNFDSNLKLKKFFSFQLPVNYDGESIREIKQKTDSFTECFF